MTADGVFIVFEGIDGSGKTTQLQRTTEYLRDRGLDVVVTREPGGTAIGEKIRALLLDPANEHMADDCELLLYGASRAQHLQEVILPALKAGKIVLCDRFSLSTVAYQGYGRGIDSEKLAAIHRVAAGDIAPRLTLVFDIPAAVSAARVAGEDSGEKDRLEQEATGFFDKVRNGFLQEAAKDDAIVVIDGALAVDEVFQAVLAAVEPML